MSDRTYAYHQHSTDPYDGFGAQWGYYTDHETGLILATNRYYDPGTGRWLTRDPAGYGGGINLYGYVQGNPIMGIDPSGLRPITAGELTSLRKLYSKDLDVVDAPLHKVNGVVRAIKAAIAAVPAGQTDPVALKAIMWAVGELGNTAWGVDGEISLGGYRSAGAGQNKCNYFVAAAYVRGASVPWPSVRPKLVYAYPPSANTLAGEGNIAYLSDGGFPTLGDIVAFHSSGDSGHATLWLGNGLLIYAGPLNAKVGTFGDVLGDGGHDSVGVRRYGQ